MRNKVKNMLKHGVKKEKIRSIQNKQVTRNLTVIQYIRQLKNNGSVVENNGIYRFHDNHWYNQNFNSHLKM